MKRVAAALVPVGAAGAAGPALQLRMHYGPRYRCRCRCRCRCVAVLVVTPSDDVLSSARIRVGAVWFGWRCDLHEVMVGVIAAGASYSSSGLQAQQ